MKEVLADGTRNPLLRPAYERDSLGIFGCFTVSPFDPTHEAEDPVGLGRVSFHAAASERSLA